MNQDYFSFCYFPKSYSPKGVIKLNKFDKDVEMTLTNLLYGPQKTKKTYWTRVPYRRFIQNDQNILKLFKFCPFFRQMSPMSSSSHINEMEVFR